MAPPRPNWLSISSATGKRFQPGTVAQEGEFDGFRNDALSAKWETIRDVRRVVTGALELERAAKNIGSSLEASPLVYVSDKAIFNTLFDIDLAEVCITSNAMTTNEDAPRGAFTLADVKGVAVVVEKASRIGEVD